MILLLSSRWVNKDRYVSLLNKAGFYDIKYGDENTEVRPDVLIICFNYDFNQLASIVDKNPLNKVFAIDSDILFKDQNVKHFTIADDLLPSLKSYRNILDTILPSSTPIRPPKKTRKHSIRKCQHCSLDIGDVGDSFLKHKEYCKQLLNRESAYGYKKVYRKKDGRSVGSVLYISIPQPIEIDKTLFNKGYHIITSRSLIKKANEVLNKTFRYRYECSSGEEC